MKATTDLSKYGYSAGWVEFGRVDGLILTGGGTFDGQGARAWPFNKCFTNSTCKLLPMVSILAIININYSLCKVPNTLSSLANKARVFP